MSRNPLPIHVFTDESLRAHDLNIAAKVHQATTLSVVRQMNAMNPGQQLHAARDNASSLYWDADKLNKVLDNI